jgi:ribulose-5-phosphate 4-epimerase/fuculose-1-phosphate aldolase
MARTESGADLNQPQDVSLPYKRIDFEVPNIGGGFLVVNNYGDYIMSAARIEIGVIGEDWTDFDSALLYLHRNANLTSTKCITIGLKNVAGACALLYFKSKELAIEVNRKTLLSALISNLQNLSKTSILWLPTNLTPEDLVHMQKANVVVNIAKHPNPVGVEEKKADTDVGDTLKVPVPKALVSVENLQVNVAAICAAYSSFGSVVTLTKAKQWNNCCIIILGVTPLSCELYHLLARETPMVFLSDPDSAKYEETIIPPRCFVPWDKALAAENDWDIVIFCSSSCPILDEATISSIRCKALVSLSSNFLPYDQDQRYQALNQLRKKDIFEAAEGLSDLGEIAKMYSLVECSNWTFEDSFDLGCRVMQTKLRLHGIIISDDVSINQKFHDLILHGVKKNEHALETLRLEEQRMRVELSDAYRITREFGMDELVWNHISVLLSDGSFLITPGSRMFDDIAPDDLVKSSGNITADIIHEAVYRARSDVKAIVHLHTPATVAVSCLEMGFVPIAQEAAPFVGRVGRHPWHGVSNDREEQALIGESIKNEKINTLLMENHGFCTFGRTLGEAWVLAYYFDKSCQTQLNCLKTGQKIKYPNEKVLAHAAEQSMLPEFLPGACEWDALRKMLTRIDRIRR